MTDIIFTSRYGLNMTVGCADPKTQSRLSLLSLLKSNEADSVATSCFLSKSFSLRRRGRGVLAVDQVRAGQEHNCLLLSKDNMATMHRNNKLFRDQSAAATFGRERMCCTKQLLGFNVTTVSGGKDKCALRRTGQWTERCYMALHTLTPTLGARSGPQLYPVYVPCSVFLLPAYEMKESKSWK